MEPKVFVYSRGKRKLIDISLLKIGDIVKVSRNGEAFWVKVSRIEPNYHFYGIVNNPAVNPKNGRLGSLIKFKLIKRKGYEWLG